MKFFERDGKFNFVDENNVFVGYNSGQSCCENADWFISKGKINCATNNGADKDNYNLENYSFDKDFFEEVNNPEGTGGDGGMVRFKLVAKDKPDLFLHLFNQQNGYYGHGFTMEIGGQVIQEGYL